MTHAEPSLLGVYLTDHLAGATAGVDLFRRCAGNHAGTPEGATLARLLREVQEDRESLLAITRRLGFPLRRYKLVGGWLLEKVTRLKPNGRLVGRTALDPLIELESMGLGLAGKGAGWRTLRELTGTEPRLDPAELDRLIARNDDHVAQVEALRISAVRKAFLP